MEINAKATVAPSINSNLLMFLNSKPHLPLESPVSVCCGCRRNPNARLRLSARCSSSATVTATVTEEESQQAPSKSVARRLILLRHAKSSWDNPSLRDHDRPLSKAGKDDAVQVSQKLQQLGWIPQLILSSDATRTRETLKIMQEQVTDLLDAETFDLVWKNNIMSLLKKHAVKSWACQPTRVLFVHVVEEIDLTGLRFFSTLVDY
ncbi:hypothetical protein GH714_027427 [Hevea brasiliensis]|uniref:Phosphoglycerate mutase family protein n=1 Tax=Hevea brasiliensis TaxID=3981 RepID=A0A6A6MG81_HEVBR|nr:hypothetical protein GH714_027427 [Hevea brasiliensis]